MLILLMHNDSTGTDAIGNYDWDLRINTTTLAHGRVEGFRRTQGAAKLVAKVSRQLLRQPVKHAGAPDTLMEIMGFKRVVE